MKQKTFNNQDLMKKYIQDFSPKLHMMPYHFNILDSLIGSVVENSHTAILKQILKYYHPRFGYLLLNSFVETLGFDVNIIPNKLVFFNSEMSTSSNKRADLVIYQPDNFVLLIENKINGAKAGNNQLKNYINDITNGKILNNAFTANRCNVCKSCTNRMQKIWVVYLSGSTFHKPSKKDLIYLMQNGFADSNKPIDTIISGSRYKSITYQFDILPWLNGCYSLVPISETSLHFGLSQYIMFLNNSFGNNTFFSPHLLNESREWVFKNKLNNLPGFNAQSKYLHKLVLAIDKKIKWVQSQIAKGIDEEYNLQCLRLLRLTACNINEQFMAEFVNFTKEHFGSNLTCLDNMSLCRWDVRHYFDYYYLNIIQPEWKKRGGQVSFSWYPLGAKLEAFNKNGKFYTFCLNIDGTQKFRKAFYTDVEFKRLLKEVFLNEGKDPVPSFENNHLTRYSVKIKSEKSFLGMDHNSKKEFLRNVYETHVTPDLVRHITKIVNSYQNP